MVNEDYEPSESDEWIIDVLAAEGRVNPYLLREETGLSKQAINERLKQLTAAGWVRKVTRGLYEFNEDPRDGGS